MVFLIEIRPAQGVFEAASGGAKKKIKSGAL
jgi:hypothetical protein